MKPPFGGLVTAGVSAFFALLMHCRGEAASPENDIPAWYRSWLVTSKFCAICEVSESSTRPDGTYKVVQLFRGHREDLPKLAVPYFKDTTLGTRDLIVSGGGPNSPYFSSTPIKNGAVRINVDQSATGFDLPTVQVPLSRIAQVLKAQH